MSDEHPVDQRYSRQVLLPSVGVEGQRRLGKASVLVVGVGGLGSFSASLLVRMGVARVRVVDRDLVELTNLHRTAHYTEDDVGRPKVEALGQRLRLINSSCSVEVESADMNAWNVLQLLDGMDLVLDGLDNWEGRFLLNDAALKVGVPWVYSGVIGTLGSVATFLPQGRPCLRCLVHEAPAPGELPTCDSVGVIGYAPALTASLQVRDAVDLIVGRPRAAELFSFDLEKGLFHNQAIDWNPKCPACVKQRFDYLDAEAGTRATSQCGNESVVIRPGADGRLDLEGMARALSGVHEASCNGFHLQVSLPGGLQLIVFRDGTGMVRGTRDVELARSYYTKIVGM